MTLFVLRQKKVRKFDWQITTGGVYKLVMATDPTMLEIQPDEPLHQ
jgi:hypothetical protein